MSKKDLKELSPEEIEALRNNPQAVGRAMRGTRPTTAIVDDLPQPWAPMPLSEVKQRHWTTRAVELAKLARMDGVVITIEQQPCEPLAMGNHRDIVTVREVRK